MFIHWGPVSLKGTEIGGYQDGRPWETCMTICRQWAWKPIDTIVKITLDGSAMDLKAVGPPRDFGTATASNVFRNEDNYGAGMACDGDPATRWATDAGTGQCWIEAPLEKPGTIRGIEIRVLR